MNKNIKVFGIILAIVVLGALAVWFRGNQNTSSAETERFPTSVRVTTPSLRTVEDKVYSIGEIAPMSTYNVMVLNAGTVDKTYFENGDVVKQGDILFKMETDTINVQQSANKSQLENAVRQAETARDQAKDNYDNQKMLFDQGAISKSALDSAQVQWNNSELALQNAQSNLKSSEKQMDEQYDAYVQRSPISGKIVTKNINEGQTVSSQIAYTIIPDSAFIISSSVASKEIGNILKDQDVEIYVGALSQTYNGKVSNISDLGNKGTYPIEISLEASNDLRSGMYAEVWITVDRREEVLMVPLETIVNKDGMSYVFKVNEDMTVDQIPVEVGIKQEGYIEIKSGLKNDEQIVSSGSDFMEEGMSVTIVE